MRFHHGWFPGQGFLHIIRIKKDDIHNVIAYMPLSFNLKKMLKEEVSNIENCLVLVFIAE